jgi:hypothetical protein
VLRRTRFNLLMQCLSIILMLVIPNSNASKTNLVINAFRASFRFIRFNPPISCFGQQFVQLTFALMVSSCPHYKWFHIIALHLEKAIINCAQFVVKNQKLKPNTKLTMTFLLASGSKHNIPISQFFFSFFQWGMNPQPKPLGLTPSLFTIALIYLVFWICFFVP